MAGKTDTLEIAKLALLGAGLFLAYKVFKGTGLIKTGQEAEANQLNQNVSLVDWSKPGFWKKPAPTGFQSMVFTTASTNDIIKKLYDSAGVFNDCEECMEGQLKRLTYKTQYSWLVDKFREKYNQDLTAFLKNYYNETELYPVWKHIEQLPTYKKL